jgi:hypothetical protein
MDVTCFKPLNWSWQTWGKPVFQTKFEIELSRTTNRTSGQYVSVDYNVPSHNELWMLSSINMDSCLHFNRPGRGQDAQELYLEAWVTYRAFTSQEWCQFRSMKPLESPRQEYLTYLEKLFFTLTKYTAAAHTAQAVVFLLEINFRSKFLFSVKPWDSSGIMRAFQGGKSSRNLKRSLLPW